MANFADQLIRWQQQHGRHHLPWQNTHTPYAIWISEVMLQQTQVKTVIPYYQQFMQRFPTINSLAKAPLDAVLILWSGLGYYSRARHLHQTACIIMKEYQGQFPPTRPLIQQLPGIGRSTAAAIAVFAFGQREAILDGNVKRILARYFGIEGYPNDTKIMQQLWHQAEELLPDYQSEQIRVYTQALMDLGSLICTRHKPRCTTCPLQENCTALRKNCVELLPSKKKRNPLPRKEMVFLILQQQQKILLQKRPSNGIWAELWSLPELMTNQASNEEIIVHCRQKLGLTVNSPTLLPLLDHQFTHFKLRIHPQLRQVVPQSINTPTQIMWVTPDKAVKHAIPTPVRQLILQTFSIVQPKPRNQSTN